MEYGELRRHFCEEPVCPDPVWKLSSSGSFQGLRPAGVPSSVGFSPHRMHYHHTPSNTIIHNITLSYVTVIFIHHRSSSYSKHDQVICTTESRVKQYGDFPLRGENSPCTRTCVRACVRSSMHAYMHAHINMGACANTRMCACIQSHFIIAHMHGS